MPQTPFKVAAIQMASSPNVSANLLQVEKLLGQAVKAGAELVVLPENFAFMGKHDRDQLTLAESDRDGPLQQFLSHAAERFGLWLVGGTIPMGAEDSSRVRSACLVFDQRGRRVARYDKLHLFDVELPEAHERYNESSTIEPGHDIVVIDSPFGRLGIAVCYDLRFPELFRQMLDDGLDLLAIPAAFTAITGKAHWETLVRARAIENLSFVIAAAQGGYHVSGRETHGHSMIVDPWGTVLAELPRGAGCVTAELDRAHQRAVRRSFPTLNHRRLKVDPLG